MLDTLGERYMFQKGFIQGAFYCIVDFYLPQYRLCIEVDGGYHFSDEQRKKDYAKDRYLKVDRRLKVLRISNDVAENIDADSLAILISKSG